MKKIAVVGANGFIGSNLKQVFVADYGRLKGRQIECDFLDGDWLRKASTKQLRARLCGKGLLHLAENPNILHYESDDLMLRQYRNALNLLEFSVEPKVYMSSYLVYASLKHPDHGGLKESDAVFPGSSYATHKLRVEKLFLDFGGTAIRSANLYGGTFCERKGFIETVIKSLARGEVIELDNGSNVRDFFYIEQFANCLFRLMQLDDLRGIYNLGSGYGLSLAQVVHLVGNALGIGGSKIIKCSGSPNSSPDIRYLDCSKAEQAIGSWPDTSLTSILPKIV